MEQMAGLVVDRLAKNLVSPLWDMDEAALYEILSSEMAESRIQALMVKEGNKKEYMAGYSRDNNWQLIEAKQIEMGDYITASRDIIKDEEKLGNVSIFLTKKFMNQDLDNSIRQFVVTIVLLNFLLLISAMFPKTHIM